MFLVFPADDERLEVDHRLLCKHATAFYDLFGAQTPHNDAEIELEGDSAAFSQFYAHLVASTLNLPEACWSQKSEVLYQIEQVLPLAIKWLANDVAGALLLTIDRSIANKTLSGDYSQRDYFDAFVATEGVLRSHCFEFAWSNKCLAVVRNLFFGGCDGYCNRFFLNFEACARLRPCTLSRYGEVTILVDTTNQIGRLVLGIQDCQDQQLFEGSFNIRAGKFPFHK